MENNEIKKQLLKSVKENAIIEKTDDKITRKQELIAYVFYPYKGKNRKQYFAETSNIYAEPSVLFEEIVEKIYNDILGE